MLIFLEEKWGKQLAIGQNMYGRAEKISKEEVA